MKRILLLFSILFTVSSYAQTTWMVDSLNDSGFGSLRAAADSCSAGDTIRFNSNLIANGSDSIVLTSGEISFGNKGVVIRGVYNLVDTLFISGSQNSRIFSFDDAGKIVLDSLVLVNGNGVGVAYSGKGGAVYMQNCTDTLFVINSIISGNTAYVDGGGIYIISTNYYSSLSSSIIVTNSTLSGNNASTGSGGGIYCYSVNYSSVSVTNSTISGNTASGNIASKGGGIYCSSPPYSYSSVSVINSTISGNTVFSWGGGVFCHSGYSSSVSVINSTISGNTATYGGGGVVSISGYSSSIGVTSSIIAENGSNSSGISNITSGGYNIFSDTPSGTTIGSDSTNITAAQLNLQPLAYNGGSTQTMLPGIGSIAIDNGNPNDSSDAQNLPISGRRDIGAAEHCTKTLITDTIISCDSYYTWIDGVTYEEDNNIATYEISDSASCGTIVTLNLTLHSSLTIDTVHACDSIIWIDGNTYYPNHGLVTDTLVNSLGCDSVIMLHFIPSNFAIDYQFACDSLVWIDGLTYYMNNNTAKDTLTSVFGCDSVVTLNLIILQSTSSMRVETVCDSFISPSGKVWDSTAVYQDTILNSNNCDSIITIDLTVNLASNTVISEVVCDSLVSPSGRFVWFSNGIYQDTITNTHNCDSVITINLTVLESTFSSIFMEECYEYTSPSGLYIWDSSGVYSDTVLNSLGCDSVITVNLTIKNTHSYSVIDVCNSYLSPSGKYIWTSSGLYMDTLSNSMNCDSLISIDLSVNTTFEIINETVCDSAISPSGNFVWYSSGTYLDTLVNSFNCDSILTMNLTVNNPTWATINESVCDSLVSPSGNYVWTNSGIYYDTVLNVSGCDSLITYNLTVKESSNSTVTEFVCGEYSSPSGNYVWTNSGIYLDTVLNSVGCDSVITIDLTIFDTLSTEVHFVCDSLTWINGITYFSDNNTAIDTLQNSLGCDSLVYLDLTVYPSYEIVDSLVVCDSLLWVDGNTYYSSNNSSVYYGTSVYGCDSVVTLNLTVNQSTYSVDSISACLFYQWIDGQVYLTNNNTATYTVIAANGCDSVVALDLEIGYGSVGVDIQVVCDSLIWLDGNVYYSNNTIAVYNMVGGNSEGCDSIITLNLTVNGSQSVDIISACDSLTWINGVTYYSSNNTAKDTLVNALGCDSIVSLDLTITNSSTFTDIITACDSLTWINGVTYYSNNSEAKDTLINFVGCDSLVSLDLTILNATVGEDVISSCSPITWLDGNVYTQTIFGPLYTLVNSQGCDSVVTLDFTLLTVDTGVVRNYLTLTSQATNATYQWIDCDNGLITGEVNASFLATQNGSYQVEVTQNGCVDTSDCFVITSVGIGKVNLSNNINIYPNPVHEQVNVEITNWPTNGVGIVVIDIAGKQVYTQEVEPVSNQETIQINTSKWAKGTYFIEVGEEENRVVEKIVVQ